MSRHALKVLAALVVALIVALVAMEAGEENGSAGGDRLLPDLKNSINDITSVTVDYAGNEGSATLRRQDGAWVLVERGEYPADVAELRKLLLAMADATILEQKTADPARYDRLGVQDPEIEDSEGIRVVAAGDGFSMGLIVGNSPNPGSRYVRRDGEAASWLVNTDPEPPASVAGWLARELFDVDASRLRAVTIAHSDGETVRVVKANASDAAFSVEGVPAGRELSYPTIGNPIGGALNDLQLEDVRPAETAEPAFTTTFEAFDGLLVTARGYEAEDGLWLGFEATATEAPPAEAPAVTAGDESETAEPAPEEASPDPSADAARINARTAGWQFRIPDYKVDQFSRRWSDLLNAAD
ncbi:MAG: DUF4340 domain-containing protein [Gammaproteobacteria bacterium]|nr:DUF4340 domain-containing protein [Gammaproteobacteria bacterium]MDH4254627.1 DUF4340 domain-containing protein [Gammaproteobacteria bacterium]MDH5309455.1 DUF4340 domain-containing protein [Gammaproteobacteria bacterium]